MNERTHTPGSTLTRGQRLGIWGGMGGAVIGGTIWLIAMAGMSGDWLTVALTVCLDVAVFFLFVRWLIQFPHKRFALLAAALVILTVHCLAMFWWRLDVWRAPLNLSAAELLKQKKVATYAIGGMMSIVLAQVMFMQWLQTKARNRAKRR